jgi:hypothetical protein
MPSLTPYIGRSSARLLALLNADNGTNYQEGVDLTFGEPVIKAGPGTRNTQVTITPVDTTKYSGPQDLHYTRLGLDALSRLPNGALDVVEIPALPFSIHQVLPQINTALGLNLTPAEVEDTIYTESAPTYALKVVGNASLAWVDSEFSFPVHITGEDVWLGTVITNTSLDGFNYAQPETP